MKLKKALSALLLLSLAAGTLSACGGGDGAPAATTAGQTETSDVTAAETTTSEYKAPEKTLGGAVFKYGMLQQPNPNWIIRTYIEGCAEEMNGDPINDAIYTRSRLVEETLDVKIEPKIYNDISTVTNATLAGDVYADAVTMSGTVLRTVLAKNMLLDLFTIDTLDLERSWWDQNSVDELTIGGKLFAAVGNISSFSFVGSYSVFVNKGILEDYKLDNPYDIVRAGEWTFDKMGEMGRKVASDLNGDGVTGKEDMFGLSSEPLGMVMLSACGVRVTEKDKDGIPSLVLDKYDVPGALEKIVPILRDKKAALYSNDYSSDYTNVFRQLIVEKFISDELLFINNWLLVALELRNMESDFGILPPPKRDEKQAEYIDYGSETWVNYAVVPVTTTALDKTGYVMDALGYYGKTEIYSAVIDKTITSKTLRDTDTEEMLDIIYKSRRYELAGIFDWGGVNSFLNGFISNQSTDFASAYAAKETTIKTAITSAIEAITK